MPDFELKDSGQRQEFPTGARRDLQEGKGRPDLISTLFLQRLAVVMEKGASKYGDRNWEKGMPLSRYYSSAIRHLMQAFEGRTDEDHLGQAAFNVMAFMHTQEMIRRGLLAPDLNDVPQLENHVPYDGFIFAPDVFKEAALEAGWATAVDETQEHSMRDAGLVECLDGVWRPSADKDPSVKNPGEVQTPIYAQPAVFDPPTAQPMMDALRNETPERGGPQYGETGEWA